MEIQEDIAEQGEEREYNDALAVEPDNVNESDDEDDTDFKTEIPDVGRNSLIYVHLNAASTVDEINANHDDN